MNGEGAAADSEQQRTGRDQTAEFSSSGGGDDTDSALRVRTAITRIGRQAQRSNTERAARLRAALDALLAGGLNEDQRAAAVEAAHQLVGSAGTFGFWRASDLAQELEHFFERAEFEGEPVAAARRLIADLQRDLAAEPAEPPEDA